MGGSDSKLVSGKPVVVILGCGYGGMTAAKVLDETGKFNVVVIDRKNYFLHNVGSLRAVVEPAFAEKTLISYDRLLKNGSVFQAEASEVSPAVLRVHGREEPIRFDYLVIALGTSYAYPAKIAEPNRRDALQHYAATNQLLQQRQNIVIIGGGATGVELAGEIATEFPSKSVTLISATPQLLHGTGVDSKVHEKLHAQLTSKRVNCMYGHRAVLEDFQGQSGSIALNYFDGRRVVRTDLGAQVNADIVFMCIGPKVNNGSLKAHFGHVMDASGRLLVDEHLRVRGCPNVFAIGDISAIEEGKLAFLAGKQAKHAAQNILNAHAGKNLKSYALNGPAIGVTVGRDGGAGQFPIGKGMIVGKKVMRAVKSKDFFHQKMWAELNQKIGREEEGPRSPAIQNKNFASALSLTELDAENLRAAGLQVPQHRGESHT